nr:MAG TPA: hypothetical protein [Bacteriophage sp.]
MENYICINGKKAELTEEQMKALGIELQKDSPFDRAEMHKIYYYISPVGDVKSTHETEDSFNKYCFDIANYCTDKAIMEQRALHETLSRLLWRFSEQNGGRGVFSIADKGNGNFCPMIENYRYLEPTFKTADITNRAIKEIIEPFMAKHPDFVW